MQSAKGGLAESRAFVFGRWGGIDPPTAGEKSYHAEARKSSEGKDRSKLGCGVSGEFFVKKKVKLHFPSSGRASRCGKTFARLEGAGVVARGEDEERGEGD